MKINAYEAGMLDAVLESFGDSHTLSQTQLTEIFDGDDVLAGAITALLVQSGMVTLTNGILTRLPEARLFLDVGGFQGQYEGAQNEEIIPEPALPQERSEVSIEQYTPTDLDEREDTIRQLNFEKHKLKNINKGLLALCALLILIIAYLLYKHV